MTANAVVPEVGHWRAHECSAEYRPQTVNNDDANRTCDDALDIRTHEDASVLKQNGGLGQAQASLVNRNTGPKCLKHVSGNIILAWFGVITLFISFNSSGDTDE